MARLTKLVTINDRGTDKTFEIKEMSSYDMEDFGARAALLLLDTGVLGAIDIDALTTADLMPLLASIIKKTNGFQCVAGVDQEALRKMRHELLETVSIITPGGAKLPLTRQTIEGNIDDFKVLYKLEAEALKLNLNFLPSGESKTLDTSAPARQSAPPKPRISVR